MATPATVSYRYWSVKIARSGGYLGQRLIVCPERNELLGGAFVARADMEIDRDSKLPDYKKHLKQPLICAGDGPIMKYREYAAEFFA